MLRRYSRLFAAVLALPLAFVATAAGADVLWDQSQWTQTNEGSVTLSSNSCSQLSGNTKAHVANDVTFANPVVINTVRIYETLGNVEAASQAYLWIAPKTGPLPTAASTDVNNAANIKPITISYETINNIKVAVVTCTGLNIPLTAGSYWVSLTPRHSLGLFPYTVALVTDTIVGDESRVIVACTANSDWLQPIPPTSHDYAMKIEGQQPTPAEGTSWGKVRALYR